MKEKFTPELNTKILVPAMSYDFSTDKRLLIPFTKGDKIGFVNQEGEVVVKPQFSMYYGNCYSQNDRIRVSKIEMTGYAGNNGKISCYDHDVYGLLNCHGEYVLEPIYRSILPSVGDKTLYTVMRNNKGYAVLDDMGKVIVPYGKYDYIGGFDKGFARVKIGKGLSYTITHDTKWGIIDETGTEVLPVEYDSIWKFYNKPYSSMIVVKGGVQSRISFNTLGGKKDTPCITTPDSDDDDYGSHYGEFEGTYAQDVMGYSDDVINDAFDGEADAYWNID